MKKINIEYSNLVNKYIKLFQEKQDMEFDFWYELYNSIVFGDYCFKFSDIIFDLTTDQPKHRILDWFNVQLEKSEKKESYEFYSTYCKKLNKDERDTDTEPS